MPDKFLRRQTTTTQNLTVREVYCNNSEFNKKFTSNRIRTAKYTFFTFFPKALFIEFSHISNCYFLLIAILQCIPQISPLSPFSAIAPLTIVISLSLLREFFEDRARQKYDIKTNKIKTKLIIQNERSEYTWGDIKVGDLISVRENEIFPADMLLIQSSSPHGLCYIETSSLDGEKNLKPRSIPEELHIDWGENFKSRSIPEELPMEIGEKIRKKAFRFEGKMTISQPNSSLNEFSGYIEILNKKINLKPGNLLLRGSKLRNTEDVYGVVVYTGCDTKIMKNSERSKLILCVICAVGNFSWNYLNATQHFYLQIEETPEFSGFLSFFSYFLLNNTMIPISLIVTLEFVKLSQAYFIVHDDDFRPKKGASHDEKAISVFSSSLNEELGKVEYIFSDKTGTLTCNLMLFKYALVGDKIFGDQTLSKSSSFKDSLSKNFRESLNAPGKILNWRIAHRSAKKQGFVIRTEKHLLMEYLLALATCHECIAEKVKGKKPIFQGPSPDEIALLDAAYDMGATFLEKTPNKITVVVKDKKADYEILRIFEFNSDRKRMSIMLKSQKHVRLFIKGADSVIIDRLSKKNKKRAQLFVENIVMKLNEFSKQGLRTLCVAMKVLDVKEAEEILKKIDKIPENSEKEKAAEAIVDKLERDLFLIGATAVEDKLQPGVPNTIRDLLRAGIKIWMLTGDKLETAENIAKSCKLIDQNSQIFRLGMKSNITQLEEKRIFLEGMLNGYLGMLMASAKSKKSALLVEGDLLYIIFHHNPLRKIFLHLVKEIESVVCCRVTPKQKADVVSLVKTYLKKITMSVGDGANDVNMIQEADIGLIFILHILYIKIGIGIYGQEGVRAVQASDFAVGEFRGLWKLILVHGRWSHFRISKMIVYFFYKNMIFTIPHFLFGFLCCFSGQTIFDDWYISLYNLLFTSFPLVMRSIFEKDVYYKSFINDQLYDLKLVKKNYPFLYSQTAKLNEFDDETFFYYVIRGMLHGFFLFYLSYAVCLDLPILNEDGFSDDFWMFSIVLFTLVVLIANIQLAISIRYWYLLTFLAFLIPTFGAYVAYMWISNFIIQFPLAFTVSMLFRSSQFYLLVILVCAIIFIVELCLEIKKIEKEILVEYFKEMITNEKQKIVEEAKIQKNGADSYKKNKSEIIEMKISS